MRDLNSRNGTSVNGHKLSPNESVQLQEGIWYALEESAFGMKECRNSVDTRTGK